jgi:hypothetical protein
MSKFYYNKSSPNTNLAFLIVIGAVFIVFLIAIWKDIERSSKSLLPPLLPAAEFRLCNLYLCNGNGMEMATSYCLPLKDKEDYKEIWQYIVEMSQPQGLSTKSVLSLVYSNTIYFDEKKVLLKFTTKNKTLTKEEKCLLSAYGSSISQSTRQSNNISKEYTIYVNNKPIYKFN